MSIKAEKTFIRLLPDLDAVEYVIREGMPERVLPTEDLRPVYTWAMDYYRQSRKAPTVDALHDRFTADFFADHDIDLSDEPEESIEWVVETLQANFVRARTAVISKDIVTEVAQAAPEDRVEVLAQNASRLSALVADLTPRVQMVDLREEVVRVIEDHDAAAADGGRFHGLSFGLDQVDAHYGGVKPGEIAVIAAPAKMGKAAELTTPVLTPSGWSTIGDLKVGDEVIGRDGHPTRVVQLHPIVDLPVYRLTTADGGTTVCSEQHLWTIQTRDQRTTGTSMTIETTELARRVGRGQTVYLPMVDPVQHPEADLPIHPYVMGVLIGDGSLSSGTVAVTKQDIDLHEKVAALHGQEPVYWTPGGRLARTSALHGLAPTVRDLGLDVTALHKFIPEQYLTASVQQRTDLLNGLLDADGERLTSPSGGGTTRYCTSSHRLAKDVQALVWSLGGTATIKAKATTHAEHYRVSIRLPLSLGCPFTTARKVAQWEASQPVARTGREPSRRVVSVEPEGVSRVRCITVENEDGLYVTEDYIVTHNSQMLTYIALKNWERGKVVALNTLENSVDMTTKRIACQALGLDYTELDRGMLSPQDMISLLEWTNDVLLVSDTPLHILQPTARTPYALVQQAAALDAEAILVDQLTFVEGVTPNRNAARHEVVRDIMRAFKVSIQGRNQVPLLMAHQITREGIKAAEKTGSLRMTDLAESSEVERASDLIFALYGSEDMVRSGGIQFQCLAARRVPPRSFDLHWHPAIGGIGVRNIIDPEFLED